MEVHGGQVSARSGRLCYLPALDGLRGLAVLAVLLFHAGLGFVGGQLGVPVFFTLYGRERRLAPDKEFDVDPVCQWWDDPNNDRRTALEKFAPDVIVVEDGINEVFERRRDEWGGWRSAGQPQFDSRLAQ